MRHPPSVYQRRRAVAVAVACAVLLLAGVAAAALTGGDGDRTSGAAATQARATASAGRATPPPELPRGGRRLFPDWRVVAFYGAPQDEELGALGIGTPDQAARRLERLARLYARRTRPVLPALELIATIANAHPGADGLYKARQDAEVIDRYLRAARRHRALLVLDIQPGRADFMTEVRRLERWLREPDVGLALDPEWSVGPGEAPGQTIGSISAAEVNEVSAYLAGLVRRHRLPEKLLVIHQFTAEMIEDKASVARRPGLAITMNVDGFGDRPNKRSKYELFTSEGERFHDGFKVFFREDVNRMPPSQVLALQPPPDLVVYE